MFYIYIYIYIYAPQCLYVTIYTYTLILISFHSKRNSPALSNPQLVPSLENPTFNTQINRVSSSSLSPVPTTHTKLNFFLTLPL
jgi:hypothetical protein